MSFTKSRDIHRVEFKQNHYYILCLVDFIHIHLLQRQPVDHHSVQLL